MALHVRLLTRIVANATAAGRRTRGSSAKYTRGAVADGEGTLDNKIRSLSVERITRSFTHRKFGTRVSVREVDIHACKRFVLKLRGYVCEEDGAEKPAALRQRPSRHLCLPGAPCASPMWKSGTGYISGYLRLLVFGLIFTQRSHIRVVLDVILKKT